MALINRTQIILPTSALAAGSWVSSQFIKEGDVISRGGHLIYIAGGAIVQDHDVVSLVGIDMDDERIDEDMENYNMVGFSIAKGVMVQLYDTM